MNRKRVIFLLIVFALLAFRFLLYPKLAIINGYAAKMMCSCAFIADMEENIIHEQDLGDFPVSIAQVSLDKRRRQASSHFLGMQKRTAVYKDDLGCTLIHDKDDYNVSFKTGRPKRKFLSDTIPYPYGRGEIPSSERSAELQALLENYLDEYVGTRALVILHNGKLVAESYAEEVDKDTPLLGWSMTKSILNTLVGIMVKEKLCSIDELTGIEAWDTDDRKNIKIEDLLRMESGIEWEETYTKITDVTEMLYSSESAYISASSNLLEFEPRTYWEYASGTTNILSGWMRSKFENYILYQAYPYIKLFVPLDINDAQLEMDEAGNYIYSSYCFMPARDWGKLGQLYLNDGIWNGERILPEGWVSFSTKPTSSAKEKNYGSHIWLNKGKLYPSIPTSAYYFSGYQGQRVLIIPEYNLVVVRLGIAQDDEIFDRMVGEIINTL